MKSVLAVMKALSDRNRVRLLCALRGGELCVCQLIELVGLAPSTVSKHMSLLSQAELVESRKQGRWVYYGLPQDPTAAWPGRLANEVFDALKADGTIAQDEERLRKIRTRNLEELCHKILTRRS